VTGESFGHKKGSGLSGSTESPINTAPGELFVRLHIEYRR